MLSKKSSSIILIIILLGTVTGKGQLSEKTFQKQIYVAAPEVRMDTLLRIFSRQTGVEFSFNSKKISPSKKVNVARHTQSLSQWLTVLSNSLGIQHKVVGNHIILIDNEKAVTGQVPTNPQLAGSSAAVLSHEPLKQSQTKNQSIPRNEMHHATGEVSETVGVGGAESPVAISVSDTNSIASAETVSGNKQVKNQNSDAQEQPKNRTLQLSGGSGRHSSSGGMYGPVFAAEYAHYFNKKWSLSVNVRAGIHNREWNFSGEVGGVPVSPATLQDVVTGMQFGVNGGYSLINNGRHEFRIDVGPFVRYQMASSTFETYYWPPQITINQFLFQYGTDYSDSSGRTPLTMVTFGVIGLAQYNYTFGNNIFLGLQTGFQTDTKDTQIFQRWAIVIGKRF